MKRFFSLLCLVSLLFSLAGCSSSLADTEESLSKTEIQTAETKNTQDEELPTGPITYPEGFSVGYARVDVTPDPPMPTYDDRVALSVHDPIQLTCTALCDGEDVFLLLSVDLRGVPTSLTDDSVKIIEKAVGVPKEHVFLNATHTHSAPDNAKLDTPELARWLKIYYPKLSFVVEKAMRDLTSAEVYGGRSHTEGITFVRRYLMADGTYQTNPGSGSNVVAHESDADTELRTLRFAREGKKDVLLVNYQTHYGGGQSISGQLSADFIHPFRETAEKELDVYFAYQQGAAGNLNFLSPFAGERLYPTFSDAIPAFMTTVKDALAGEVKLETGPMRSEASYYEGKTWNRETQIPTGSTLTVRLYAISFGDVAFCSAPYEMFDTNGVEIREASPFAMTFVCAYTNGQHGYVPSALAFPHGAYEVSACAFVPGSGEEFAGELIRLLSLCRNRV